ncbi:unnamed protein product [Cuscuta europaea]|uniref:Uncharacterized protein n=1 Tax=Cuscuta europaea TaxID=41803 RepID=A0A9P0ZXD3_CUSEU|nr:unnamed protein product [Cuscuta europaea]
MQQQIEDQWVPKLQIFLNFFEFDLDSKQRCSHIKFTARNLCSVAIRNCSCSNLCNIFPLASIRTLDLDYFSPKVLIKGLPQQTDATNVELVKLADFHFQNDVLASSFVRLLCVCQKLHKLEIRFSWTDTKCIEIPLRSCCKIFIPWFEHVKSYTG